MYVLAMKLVFFSFFFRMREKKRTQEWLKQKNKVIFECQLGNKIGHQ